MKRKLFTLLIMFLTMVGNAVWAEGSGTENDPYTGTGTAPMNLSGGTIYMENFTLEASNGLAMEITGDVTFVVKGECLIKSTGNSAAVKMIEGNSLTMDANSTGILRIDGGTQQAILGGNKNGGGGADWKIGAVNVNGGTLYLLGDIGHNGNHESIHMGGGIAFVEGTVTAGDGSSGILFQRPNDTGDWYGDLYNDRTITSPISGDIDGDGTVDNDDIHLDLNGHRLTIGEGNKIIGRRGQLDLSNGYISAYVVNYDANVVEGCAEQTNVPVDGWLYGPNTTFDILEPELECTSQATDPNGQHQFFGWVNMSQEEKTVVKANETSTTPTIQPEAKAVGGTDNYQGDPVVLKAAWAAKARTITVTNNTTMQVRALAAIPDGVITYGTASGLPDGITFDDNTLQGTPNVTDFEGQNSKSFTVTVPITVEGIEGQQTATITIIVTNNLPSLDDATISWTAEGNNTQVYSGVPFRNLFTVTATNVDNAPMSEGVHYTVTYEYTKPNSQTPEADTKTIIKEAGQYKVKSIAVRTPEEGNELAQGGPITDPQIDGEDIIITITQRPLYLRINDQKVAVGGTLNSTVNSSSVTIINKEGVGANGLATNETGATITYNGSLSTTNDMLQTVGSYPDAIEGNDISIASMSNGADANNYKIAEGEGAIEKGDLTVYLDLNNGGTPTLDPDPTEDGEGDEGDEVYDADTKTFTFPYDGKSYTLSKLTVGQTVINLDESNVSYTYSETEGGGYVDLEEGQEVKDAGWYKATVNLNTTLYPNSTDLVYTIHITPRELNVKVEPQTIKVGNIEGDPTTTWNVVFGKDDNTNTVTIENVVRNETAVFEDGATLDLTEDAKAKVTAEEAGKYESAITNSELALADGTEPDNAFKAKNYELKLTAGTLTIIRVLGNDDKDNIKGGEDGETEDGNFNDDGDYQLIGGNGEDIIYNGKPYEVNDLYLMVGEDGSKTATKIEGFAVEYLVDSSIEDNTAALSGQDNKQAINAGHYIAKITITANAEEEQYFEATSPIEMKFEIKPKAAKVTGTYQCQIGADLSSGVDVSTLTLSSDDFVSGEEATYSGTIKLKEDKNTNTEGEQPDAFDCTNVIATAAEEGNAFKASNYDITYNISLVVGKITINPNPGEGEDGDDITGGEDNTDPKNDDLDDTEDFVMIVPDGEGEISVYDGNTHELSLLIIKTDNGTYTLKETEDYTVSYTSNDNDIKLKDSKPFHAGKYTATITLNDDSKYQIGDGSSKEFTLTIKIAQRPLTVDLNIPATIKSDQDLDNLSSWWSSNAIKLENIVSTEEIAAKGTLSNAAAHINSPLPATGQNVTVTVTDVELSDSDPFFTNNYAITYKNGDTTLTLSDTDNDSENDDTSITDGTEVEDSDKITIDPTDPDTDITGGEDTDEDEDLDDKDYILVSTGDGNDVNAVYDGETHTIEYMVVTVDGKTYKLNATEDFTVSYTGEGLENGQPHDAGTYTASIEMIGKYTGNFDLNVTIKKRSLAVYFNFPLAIYDKNQISWSKDLITYKGLVEGETPAIPDECHLEVRGNRVWLVDFAFNDDPASEFETDNYIVNYQGNTGDITVNINEGTDDDHDGDIDVELPDGDIDLNPDDDPNHGGGDHGGSGINRPVHYYNIYVDTAATCDGVELSFSKEVVREGNQVSVYIDKILEGYNANDMKLWFKRSLFGYWEELEEGVQPGEYIIDHIYTDIYVKVTDVEHLPTGLEEVEGAKVYTQDGNIYVYTPSRMPVWIVSMTGALLRNEEQVGLQSYDRLTRGIYIVRVGEQVFKIQLK